MDEFQLTAEIQPASELTDHEFIFQIRLRGNGTYLTFREWLQQLVERPDFRLEYNQILASTPLDAFYWEHPAITRSTLDSVYEVVIMDAPALAGVDADTQTFDEYFVQNELAVAFPNLGRDALLVAPTPGPTGQRFPHLAEFTRTANDRAVDAFWLLVALTVKDELGEARRWISTSGLGVYWTHVRIDSYPKYYQYLPYRVM